MKKVLKGILAFSLVEVLISLITVSVVIAAFAPIMTKKMRPTIVKSVDTVSKGAKVSTDCSASKYASASSLNEVKVRHRSFGLRGMSVKPSGYAATRSKVRSSRRAGSGYQALGQLRYSQDYRRGRWSPRGVWQHRGA